MIYESSDAIPGPTGPLPDGAGRVVFRKIGLDPECVPFHVVTNDAASSVALEKILNASPDVVEGSVVRDHTWPSAIEASRNLPPMEITEYTFTGDGPPVERTTLDTDKLKFIPGGSTWSREFLSPAGEAFQVRWMADSSGSIQRFNVGPDMFGLHRF
jgi:hypothetical protein